MADKIKLEVLIMNSMICKFRQMGDKFGTIINKLRQAQSGVKNAYIGDSSIKIQSNINDVLKSGKEVTEILYKLSIQLNSAKDAIIRADKESYNNIKSNTIIRGEDNFSKVTASKETINNMEKVIGYFTFGAMYSISDNLALGLPGLTGLYNDKRLRYNLENENRYGVLAAYQYGKTFGDLEGVAQGTAEFFGGLSIMGFGGFGAGALTVATDGAAAPAVPWVESVGVAVAGHGIGMATSSFSHMSSDFAKGNFYFSQMERIKNKSLVNGPYVKNGKPKGRPTLSGKKKLEFEKNVYKDNIDLDGILRDPNTGDIINWEPGQSRKNVVDFGHKSGYSYKDMFKKYKNGEITIDELKKFQFDPDNYRLETPSANRSHKYE